MLESANYLEEAFNAGNSFILAVLLNTAGFSRYLDPTRKSEWMVNARSPFAGSEEVLCCTLYSISKTRRFSWKDYRNDNRKKMMTLTAQRFIRRFRLHVLPEGFRELKRNKPGGGCLLLGHQ
jgi:hypothetical protein